MIGERLPPSKQSEPQRFLLRKTGVLPVFA